MKGRAKAYCVVMISRGELKIFKKEIEMIAQAEVNINDREVLPVFPLNEKHDSWK